MIIKNLQIVLLNAKRQEGTKKDGKPFLFYAGTFLDEESNVLKVNFSNAISADTKITKILDDIQQTPVSITLSIYQSGFNLRGTITGIDFQK